MAGPKGNTNRRIDVAGQRFGMLIALYRDPSSTVTRSLWVCRCDCGRETRVIVASLRNRNSKSCGCLRGESHKEAGHGNIPSSKEYRAWHEMKKRCYNPKVKSFKHYGARGVTICEKWRDSFSAFLHDVGRAPSSAMTLDRVDNNGNYEPGNVRWATRSQQNKNRRPFKRGPNKANQAMQS